MVMIQSARERPVPYPSGLTSHAGTVSMGSAPPGCSVPVNASWITDDEAASSCNLIGSDPPKSGTGPNDTVRLEEKSGERGSAGACGSRDAWSPQAGCSVMLETPAAAPKPTPSPPTAKAKPDRRGERQRQAAAKARKLTDAQSPTASADRVRTTNLESTHLEPEAVRLGAQIGEAMTTKSSRAGERERQRRRREEKAEQAEIEEAAKRQRTITGIDLAITPAQQAMARLKARIAAKQVAP
jgi:hypothetical protein